MLSSLEPLCISGELRAGASGIFVSTYTPEHDSSSETGVSFEADSGATLAFDMVAATASVTTAACSAAVTTALFKSSISFRVVDANSDCSCRWLSKEASNFCICRLAWSICWDSFASCVATKASCPATSPEGEGGRACVGACASCGGSTGCCGCSNGCSLFTFCAAACAALAAAGKTAALAGAFSGGC